MAAEAGDRDRMQGTVQAAVTGSAQSMPGALPAAGLKGCDAGEGGEGGFVADPAAVGPADQELGGDDGADTSLGEQCRSGGMLWDEGQQLDVELSGLQGEEPDASSDRAESPDRDAVLNGRLNRSGELIDPVELLGQPQPPQPAPEVVRCHDDQALELVDRLGAAHQPPLSGS